MFKKIQKGFLMIAALVLIIIFAVIGVTATYLMNNDTLTETSALSANQALSVADAGLSAASRALLNPTISSRVSCANATNYITDTFKSPGMTFTGAAGYFIVTGTRYAPTTVRTLTAAITNSATTIPLSSVAGLPSAGRIMIDKELIDYTSISGSNIINARRGAAVALSAVSHASGASVGLNQCSLKSQGFVPNDALTGNMYGGLRTLTQAVQLQRAFITGDRSSTTQYRIFEWNTPNELAWNNVSPTGSPARNMNAISVVSYSDAWAVGAALTRLHWDGNAWSVNATTTSSTALTGVSCTASDFCMAVGFSKSFFIWNGSSWTQQSGAAISSIPNVAYHAVSCVASNDCWAVGNTSSGEVYVHWNGTAWSRDASRPTPAQNIFGVWCISTSECYAVGNSTAFRRWNGTSWSAQSTTGLPSASYRSVACSSEDCWATGGANIVRYPLPSGPWATSASSLGDTMNAVSCNTANSCWAVGDGPIVLHWDGATWASASSGVTNQNMNAVGAVVLPSNPTAVWQETFP